MSALRFHFGSGAAPAGFIAIAANTGYTTEQGYGFDPGGSVVDQADCCTSDLPFFFSVAVPEGNYRVTLTLGDSANESDNTVRAEARRLMVEHAATKKGEVASRTFTVNVRRPKIAGGNASVAMRGAAGLDWDDKLTFEFNGARPAIDAIDIEPAADAIVVFIAGDSTVTDQAAEPYVGWGQQLPCFFDSAVSVANYAESGRALYSFRSERRLDKILSEAKKGDYVLIQFGHNDQKDKRPGAGAFTTYKKELEEYVALIKERGAAPVVVTPMYRRRFDAVGKLQESLGDYPAAGRQVAAEQKVMLIDLHQTSGKLFQALGPRRRSRRLCITPPTRFPVRKSRWRTIRTSIPTAPLSWPVALWKPSGPVIRRWPNILQKTSGRSIRRVPIQLRTGSCLPARRLHRRSQREADSMTFIRITVFPLSPIRDCSALAYLPPRRDAKPLRAVAECLVPRRATLFSAPRAE